MNELTQASATDPRELLSAVRLLAAAFPRQSWKTESEAVYTMALASENVAPEVARRAVSELVKEELELPPIALVLRKCRVVAATEDFHDWGCPSCGSLRTAGYIGGPCMCFDCDCQWMSGETP